MLRGALTIGTRTAFENIRKEQADENQNELESGL